MFVICFISQWIKRSNHGLFVFPPKKTLIWRSHCSIGQSCCSMTSKQSIDWFLESSRAWSFFKSHARLYPFDKPIKSLYFRASHFDGQTKIALFTFKKYGNVHTNPDIWICVNGALNQRREHFKRDCGFRERIHFTGFVWTSADFFFNRGFQKYLDCCWRGLRHESVFWPAIVLVNMPDSLQGSKILGNLPRKNSHLEFKQYKQYT